ncbi:hypothetical protein HZH66_010517 [Vespula vulgaris]|uniref:RRM domain-containing protein n=1 Tax=Vespula vulgaris TaxID=7454 RepID=A0A834MWE1_VESVU|nr:hypothetical protein HZH66_010517 [Vespula vulgaris]
MSVGNMETVDTCSERNRLDVLSMMVEGSTDMRSNGAAGHETWSKGLYKNDELEFQLDLVKLDKSHNGKPSKVVHIRNIPNEVSEAEIIHLGLPFGRVTNVLVLKGKNQVLNRVVFFYFCVNMFFFDFHTADAGTGTGASTGTGTGTGALAASVESIAGAPGVLPTPFAAMHGLPSPLAGPYNGVPPTGGLGGLGGFPLGAGALGVRVPGGGQSSAVLLVSNLNEEMVTPDALFTLFGVYGDVQRVKILYNKKDSALIQMAEPHQAHLAITHMDKLRVFGKQIKVVLSKHQTVQLPKEGQPDAGLTKDYTSSPLHRFKKPGSKNYQNIYPPSSTLHLSNIPATVTEEEIKDAFSKNGFNVKAFKFFPKDRKMALIQLLNMDDAVAALIKMHNYQLSESNHLRVSFSKSNI